MLSFTFGSLHDNDTTNKATVVSNENNTFRTIDNTSGTIATDVWQNCLDFKVKGHGQHFHE